MKILLGILVIVILMAATVIYSRSRALTNYVAPVMTKRAVVKQKTFDRQAIMDQLKNVKPPTPEQAKEITDQLKNVKTTITDEQKAAIMKQLQTVPNI